MGSLQSNDQTDFPSVGVVVFFHSRGAEAKIEQEDESEMAQCIVGYSDQKTTTHVSESSRTHATSVNL